MCVWGVGGHGKTKLFVAKLSLSPSEAGLSKLYNHGGTANRQPQTPNHQPATATARASESKLLDFVGN